MNNAEGWGCYVAVGLIVVVAWVVAYLVGRWVIGF